MSESAPGRAGSSNDAENKEFVCEVCDTGYSQQPRLTAHMRDCCPSHLVECPTCGNLYLNERGMKQHHAVSHGESLAKSTYECDVCGSECLKRDDQVDRFEHVTCSVECRRELVAETISGENNINWTGGKTTLTCANCGEQYDEYRTERSNYCSKKCHYESRKDGQDNPLFNKVTVDCSYCGSKMNRHPYELEEKDNLFCDRECFGQFISENNVGENHPAYTGYGPDYGPNWTKQRRKALERDQYCCQGCGATEEENGREMSVHHIKPIHKFDKDKDGWYKEANHLSNLVSLCQSCHGQWEGIPLRPDTRPE